MQAIKYMLLAGVVLSIATVATARKGDDEPAVEKHVDVSEMTLDRLDRLIRRIDEDAVRQQGAWQLSYEGQPILVVTDENADRMRIMVQVALADDLDKDQLYRLMQANFESALDARYAIANGVVWSAFIHPLKALDDYEFFSALGQTIVLRATFGTSFSSGVFLFGGGDNAGAPGAYEDILRKGQQI